MENKSIPYTSLKCGIYWASALHPELHGGKRDERWQDPRPPGAGELIPRALRPCVRLGPWDVVANQTGAALGLGPSTPEGKEEYFKGLRDAGEGILEETEPRRE